MPWAMVAALAGVAGAGASIYGASQAGGDPARPRFQITNPALFDLANLFGATAYPGRRGGIFETGPSVFDEIGLRQSIADYAGGQLSDLERAGGDVTRSVLDLIGPVEGLFGAGVLPGALEASLTGLKTDIAPIQQYAQRIFRDELLPQIRETTGATAGLSSSGLENALLRESGRVSEGLGSLEAQLSESAANRRMTAIPQLANLLAARLALPINVGSDLFGAGARERGAEEAIQRRPLDMFLQLAGISPGVSSGFQNIVGGYPTTDSTSQMLGALSTSIPQLAQGAQGIDWSAITNLFRPQTPMAGLGNMGGQ